MEHEKIFDAIEFAAQAHRGQFRKITKVPYIVHPLRVGQLLIEANCPEIVVIAGILHDTLEDTPVTLDDLETHFGNTIAQLVHAVSEPDHANAPWEERKQHTLETLKTVSHETAWITCADKLDNVLSLIEEQQRLGHDIWKNFNRPRQQQQWYYQEIVGVLKPHLAEKPIFPLYRRLCKAVHILFGKGTYLEQA